MSPAELLTDHPEHELALLTPAGATEPEARECLALKFGRERAIAVASMVQD